MTAIRPEAEVTGIYSRAGFGGSARRGTQPALIVVDLQRGFTEPAFSTGADMSGAVEATNLLLDAFHRLKAPVILTQIAFAPAEISSSMFPWLDKATGMRTLLEGAEPTALDHRLRTVPTDVIVAKKAASAFFGTGLAHMLAGRQVDTAVIVGATTSGCVRASVVDSVSSGYPTLVVREAVADRAIPPHDAALFDIREKYGDVIDLAETLDYLNTLNAT